MYVGCDSNRVLISLVAGVCLAHACARQVEAGCSKELLWKVNMYRGYLSICNSDDRQLNMIDKLVEVASVNAIREWRRLPHVVSHIHVQYLQVSRCVSDVSRCVSDVTSPISPVPCCAMYVYHVTSRHALYFCTML